MSSIVSRTVLAITVSASLIACAGSSDTTTSDTGAPQVVAPTSTTATSGVASTVAGRDAVIDPGDGGVYAPMIDPAAFTTRIDNSYLPYLPGAHWVYEASTEDGETERIEVTVTEERRMVMSVETIVVHDVVSIEGEVIEDTFDWYAQDDLGNVWYFGEDSKSYDEGQVSTAGSWEAGVDGAFPGIVMPASPTAGFAYREEFYGGEAEDLAEVVAIDGSVETPAGSFDELVVTINWTPLDPEFVERKWYAPGIGFVYEIFDVGPAEVVALVEFTPGG